MSSTPPAGWANCPICQAPLRTTERLAYCFVCWHIFTEAGWSPVAHVGPDRVLIIDGVEPYLPLLPSQLPRMEYPTLVWAVRPPEIDDRFPLLLAQQALEADAFGEP